MRSRYLSLFAVPLAAAGTCRPVPKSCFSLTLPSLPADSDAKLLSITSSEVLDYVIPQISVGTPFSLPISFCNVTVGLTHPGVDDQVWINLWLPLNEKAAGNPTAKSTWNGRYLATGGGGFAAGFTGATLAIPVHQGFATSSTDGGLTLNKTIKAESGQWAIKPDGTINTGLATNLVSRAVHDMAGVSKALIKQYYGRAHKYSYYSGCSQGGRQGYASVAKHPLDFDGVMANAPAITSAKIAIADFWGPLVMQNEVIIPSCVLDAYQKDIVAQCDPLDKAVDGLVSDWKVVDRGCSEYDAKRLVGTSVSCTEGGKTFNVPITTVYADLVKKILEGPKGPGGEFLWYGLAPGGAFNITTKTTLLPNGERTVIPIDISEVLLKMLVFRNASYDTSKMTYNDYYRAWTISAALGDNSALFGDSQISDFSGFQKSGSKLLTFVGLADETIPPPGLFRFRENIEKQLGGSDKVDEFYRLFLAPGVSHCGGGYGPQPTEPLNALIDWVEKGKAPATIPAKIKKPDGVEMTRDLCRFPKQFVYTGGDVNKASSFTCK